MSGPRQILRAFMTVIGREIFLAILITKQPRYLICILKLFMFKFLVYVYVCVYVYVGEYLHAGEVAC